MKHWTHPPQGATGPIGHQTETSRATGWRKATPGLIEAERLAQTGASSAIPKGRAVIAVKRIAADIGLKAGDLLLLDTLCAFSKPIDWEAGSRAIVWPSNGFLMDQTGMSLSTLKRNARRLVQAGIIAFHDSPNGKRWGRRGQDGAIIEAYGFDLSPMASLCETFEARAVEIAEERSLCQRLKRHITITRRKIRAWLEEDADIRQRFTVEFEELLDQLSLRLCGSREVGKLAGSFDHLLHKMEQAFCSLTDQPMQIEELTPKRVENEPLIQTTNQQTNITCSETIRTGHTFANQSKDLEIGRIVHACPEFLVWANAVKSGLNNACDLLLAIDRLRPMIGLSHDIWEKALEKLGTQTATAAFLLIFEKHCAGHIHNPSGYLRGMIGKAQRGELHLERSFRSRLNTVGGYNLLVDPNCNQRKQ